MPKDRILTLRRLRHWSGRKLFQMLGMKPTVLFKQVMVDMRLSVQPSLRALV